MLANHKNVLLGLTFIISIYTNHTNHLVVIVYPDSAHSCSCTAHGAHGCLMEATATTLTTRQENVFISIR